MTRSPRHTGTLYVLAAYVIWGLLPIYWKALKAVPTEEILAHRVFWSFVFAALLLVGQKRWAEFKWTFQSLRNRWICVLTAAILGSNWFIYIWAVNHDHIVDTSLGYFINPLLTILLGLIFLRERLNVWQVWAFVLATVGVAYLTIMNGRIPWIALSLATTFGFYGLLRKTARIESLVGMAAEIGLISPLALFYIFLLTARGEGAVGTASFWTHAQLMGAGLVTAGPLLLFTIGVRRIKLSSAGFLQYLAPSMQLLLGVLVYGEPFTRTHLISFVFIWVALLLYSLSNTPLLNRRPLTPAPD